MSRVCTHIARVRSTYQQYSSSCLPSACCLLSVLVDTATGLRTRHGEAKVHPDTATTHLHQLDPAAGIGFPPLLNTLHAEQLPLPGGDRDQASRKRHREENDVSCVMHDARCMMHEQKLFKRMRRKCSLRTGTYNSAAFFVPSFDQRHVWRHTGAGPCGRSPRLDHSRLRLRMHVYT